MKYTKKMLAELDIHNSYNLAQKTNEPIFIKYVPSDNGRLTAHYAFWLSIRFEGNGSYSRQFTVTHREVKETVRAEACQWIKNKFGYDITEKDPFGGWHITGTMVKLAHKSRPG